MRHWQKLRWQHRNRLKLSDQLVRPVERLFSRFPALERGHHSPEVTRIECRHSPLAGRRAVQITDLHLNRYHTRHDGLLRTIGNLEPDWIFVTGDLLTSHTGLPHVFRFLSELRQAAPVYLTLGNHDHHSGVAVDHFAELSDRHKLHLMINQAAFIPLSSGELGIVGLDDPSTHRADVRCIPPRQSGRFTVLLAHAPNVLDLLDHRHGVDLALCGHSHGGQWRFPSVRPFWLPYGCSGRAHGHHLQNGHWLYVNRGLGWSILPMRVNCQPEIVLIEWVNGTHSIPAV